MSTTTKNAAATEEASSMPYLEKFFINQLKDMYYAEQHLVKALGEMQKAATTEELEDAFEHHQKQTERHLKRLERVFKMIVSTAATKKCEAIEGLINEARSIIRETKEVTAKIDAALINDAQKIEHYEIATYGSLVQLAVTMDLDRVAEVLEKTLQEEEETDQELTMIAETFINVKAEQEQPYSWQQKKEMADA